MGHDFGRILCTEEIFKCSCLFWFCFELEGLAILHGVVADGNSTRSPGKDGLLCGDPGENCAGNAFVMRLHFISLVFNFGKLISSILICKTRVT